MHPKCFGRKVRLSRSLQPEHHQHIVNIFIADLERVRLDSIAFKPQRLVQPLRWQIGRCYKRDLLKTVKLASAAGNLFHQSAGGTFATRFWPHIDTPNVAFVALFVVGPAEKASSTDQLAVFKHADNEVAGGIALTQQASQLFRPCS